MWQPRSASTFFFFLGYRGIVHPPSADEGTERTWQQAQWRHIWELASASYLDRAWVFFFFLFCWVTGELSTLRQLMKVPNEPGLSPNNGLQNVSLSNQSMASNPRKVQAKCPGAKTTSHDGRAGHVMTHMCHPSKARRMASVTVQVPMQGICTPATGIAHGFFN